MPETCEDPTHLKYIEKRIYDDIRKLREFEKLDSRVDDDQRRAFLNRFSWEKSQSTPAEQAMVERLLVKCHSIFARHWLDVRINNELKNDPQT